MRRGGRLLLAIGLIAPLLAACESAPVTGRSQLMLVSESEERQMGERAYNQLLSRELEVRDGGWAVTTVDRVGRRIADAAEDPPAKMWKAPHYSWEFRTINKPVVNAFCLPGGKIAVYTGLLQVVQSDAELAAVLGHEVAHALARHSAERLSDQRAATIGLTALTVGLAVLGARSGTTSAGTSAAISVAAMAAGAGVNYGILMPMSRKQESEADHIGLVLMAMAGYDPHAAIALWERLASLSGGQKGPQWLSTHPTNDARIADLRNWLPDAMKYYRPRD
jgi:metalloendopeptidase OMA1, mitochondrial